MTILYFPVEMQELVYGIVGYPSDDDIVKIEVKIKGNISDDKIKALEKHGVRVIHSIK